MDSIALKIKKQIDRKALFADIRRVVVKLGTRVVTAQGNTLNLAVIDRLAADVGEEHRQRTNDHEERGEEKQARGGHLPQILEPDPPGKQDEEE